MYKYALAAVLGLAMCSPVAAQPNCADRDQMVTKLSEKFGETQQSYGLTPNNNIIEMFANQESGTWTALLTTSTGKSCMMASGTAFRNVQKPSGEPL